MDYNPPCLNVDLSRHNVQIYSLGDIVKIFQPDKLGKGIKPYVKKYDRLVEFLSSLEQIEGNWGFHPHTNLFHPSQDQVTKPAEWRTTSLTYGLVRDVKTGEVKVTKDTFEGTGPKYDYLQTEVQIVYLDSREGMITEALEGATDPYLTERHLIPLGIELRVALGLAGIQEGVKKSDFTLGDNFLGNHRGGSYVKVLGDLRKKLTGLEEPVLFGNVGPKAYRYFEKDTLNLRITNVENYRWMLDHAHNALLEMESTPEFQQAYQLIVDLKGIDKNQSGRSSLLGCDDLHALREALVSGKYKLPSETLEEMMTELELAERANSLANRLFQRAKGMPKRDYDKAIEALAESQKGNVKLAKVLQNI
ncbi:MAG: hypothetical protein WCV90_00335 [Candidatus Woesearchaeota archaeon]|jgi:hypothetical protein